MKFLRGIYSFDYMGHKKWWFSLSGVIIIIGLASLFVRGGGDPLHGLKVGLEFKTGTRITVAFSKPTTVTDLRGIAIAQGFPDAQIQAATNVSGSGLNGFQIQTATLSTAQEQALEKALGDAFTIANGKNGPILSSSTVGPTFGRQVVTSSWKAGILALILILGYVSFRFEWKFALGAILAEFHDLFVVVGIYSLTGREVTTATVAAVLTILGYSLYDTVIVFDRIRENAPKIGSRTTYGAMVNRSIWETLTRSINTTLMTLFPVIALLLFGGVTLKDFAFALFVGVMSGAYSSIFVASPFACWLKEREPQYRRLAARAGDAKS
jgi:SecD/SecF fusion protein